MGSLESVYQIKTVTFFCKSNSANGFMGFRIYFVSVTRRSLQIKSKLIFLTATWAHPAGVCGASCAALEAGARGGVRLPAASHRGSHGKTVGQQGLDGTQRGQAEQVRGGQVYFLEGEKADSCGPQRPNGRNKREPV